MNFRINANLILILINEGKIINHPIDHTENQINTQMNSSVILLFPHNSLRNLVFKT